MDLRGRKPAAARFRNSLRLPGRQAARDRAVAAIHEGDRREFRQRLDADGCADRGVFAHRGDSIARLASRRVRLLLSSQLTKNSGPKPAAKGGKQWHFLAAGFLRPQLPSRRRASSRPQSRKATRYGSGSLHRAPASPPRLVSTVFGLLNGRSSVTTRKVASAA